MRGNGAPNIYQSVIFDPISEMDMSFRTYPKHYISVWRGGGLAKGAGMVSNTDPNWEIAEEFVPIKFQNDGDYAIMCLFDVDSDVLRPESTPVLNEILRTMSQHGDLAIVIEGQGIETGRLSAVGRGETEPVADNATLDGRQENRRVVVRAAG